MESVELRDGLVEYAWWGPGPEAAPVLVFLHEGLGCAAQWWELPQRLAAATGCAALAYSRFGYGGSAPCRLPRPFDYHSIEAVRILPELLARLGVRRYLLVGHSDGATIALIHAGREPGRAAGLLAVVAEAPHVFVEEMTLAGIAAVRERYHQGLRESLVRHHGANVDAAFSGWAETWLHPGFREWNVEAVLPEIRVPVLLVQGRQDAFASLEQIRRLAGQLGGPAETLVVEDCGHVPHREQAEPVAAAITAFVRTVLDGEWDGEWLGKGEGARERAGE